MTAETPHQELGDPSLAPGPAADPTAHRFSSESARPKAGKRLAMVFTVLVVLLAAIGAGGYAAKSAYAKYMAEKAEKQRVEREKSGEPSRRGKQFATDVPKQPAVVASAPSLPQSFGRQSSATPIPLAAPGAAASVPLGSGPPVAARKSSMMLADADGKELAPAPRVPGLPPAMPASGQMPSGGGASHPRTVQEMANALAAKGPLTSSNQSSAAKLGDRSLLLARGAFVPCVLETDLNSNVAGLSSCVVSGDVYSDDGKVVLIDKGARVLGEYRNTLKQGDARIAVLWNRIKTPTGMVVDVDSPAADGTGAVGVEGAIDNHWMQRIGSAFLLSLVQDVVAAKTKNEQGGGTVVNTSNTSKSMAEKVLDSTINIPPTLTKNRGERLMIFVNRDLWFDSVYAVEGRR